MMENTKIPLRYHTSENMFYQEDGTLAEPEPKESLEELERAYQEACEQYRKWREKYEKVMGPYRDPQMGKIDYDKLDSDNSPAGLEAFKYAIGDFNCLGVFDEYEYRIDLKIMYMNVNANT